MYTVYITCTECLIYQNKVKTPRLRLCCPLNNLFPISNWISIDDGKQCLKLNEILHSYGMLPRTPTLTTLETYNYMFEVTVIVEST